MNMKTDYSEDKSYYILLDAIHGEMLDARRTGHSADVLGVFVDAIAILIQTCVPPEEQSLCAEEVAYCIPRLAKQPISESYARDVLEAAGLLERTMVSPQWAETTRNDRETSKL